MGGIDVAERRGRAEVGFKVEEADGRRVHEPG